MAALSLEQQLADQQLAERERLARVEAKLDRLLGVVEGLQQAQPPLLVDATEAARRLDVSLATVRRRIKAGELAVVRVGRSVRVDLSKLRGSTTAELVATARLRAVK